LRKERLGEGAASTPASVPAEPDEPEEPAVPAEPDEPAVPDEPVEGATFSSSPQLAAASDAKALRTSHALRDSTRFSRLMSTHASMRARLSKVRTA
jgi:hypothetical protein